MRNFFSKAGQSIANTGRKLKRGWSTPSEGRFLPIKEIAAYGFGGMGLHFMFGVVGAAINAQILPKMYGITPTMATLLVTVVAFINLVIMPWFYSVFDNLNSKRGKFRTFIAVLAPILALLTVVSTFAPQFEGMSNSQTLRTVYAFCTCIPVLILTGLLTNIFNMMPTAMTPNSQERTDMLTPASILYSFAPTIIGWIFNPLRGIFQEQGAEYLAYRYMGIIFAILGIILAFIIVLKTKERVYQTSQKREKIKFIHGIKSVFKNKPFLLYSLFTMFGVFKALVDTNVVYMYDYRLSAIIGEGPKMAGIIIAITGEFATVTMLLTPLLTRKISKKNLTIGANALNLILLLTVAIIGFENIPIGWASFAVCFALRGVSMLSTGCLVILGPAMLADTYDYQQFKTGERLEGFMSTVGGYIAIVGVIATFLVSILQEKIGFFPNQGVFIPGNSEYNPEFIMPIFTKWMNITAWLSVASIIVSIIPLLFYNLTEKKHKECMEIIKQRAEQSSGETIASE